VQASETPPVRILIVGGGVTGLSAAVRVRELDPHAEVTLVECSDRLGGVLQTVERDGFLIERGADNFITNTPWALDLCREVGLTDQLIGTNDRLRQALVVRQGRLERVPAGFLLMVPERIWPVLTSGLLSPWGKLRLLAEYFLPARPVDGDESLASFVTRRLGREAFERLVQPLIGGIYTADPDKLSLAATMPRFLQMERQHGGLIRARRHIRAQSDAGGDLASSGARYGLFMTPRAGLSTLVEALAARLPAGSVRLNTRATALERHAERRWSVELAPAGEAPTGMPTERADYDALILALPAPAAARLLADACPKLADELGQIEYAGVAVVSLGYRREQVGHPLDGFGFVVPANEGRSILAASFSSVKYTNRAPQGSVLIRVFVGGACQPGLAELADAPLVELVERELRELLSVSGAPQVIDIARWPKSMAQYHVGHLERVARIEQFASAAPGMALAGNAYHGVGISHCVHSGRFAAERVLASVANLLARPLKKP
jgi:protoporphyrinogen/coproporphyrinogen III oxidase